MSYDPDSYRAEHVRTWHGFVRATVWLTGAVILVLVLMALFLL